MQTLTIVITPLFDTIQTLNDKCQLPTKSHEEINALIDYLSGIASGSRPASVQVVTRGSDPGVTTDGDPKSESFVYNLT